MGKEYTQTRGKVGRERREEKDGNVMPSKHVLKRKKMERKKERKKGGTKE